MLEAVTHTTVRPYPLLADLLPQAAYMRIYRTFLAEVIIAPYMIKQRFAR